MKPTAINWLVEQLKINNYISDNAHWLIDEAKEMEYSQIRNAYQSGIFYGYDKSSIDYYEETFKNK